ncbi:MAG TPA: winged helix DNA-binding domain-containing protein [Kofleriaceae bacterium]|nr:winged helix DNA-binding domain-containing protein [Kofleriaceae bacterium]
MHPVLAARLAHQHLARPTRSAPDVVAAMAAIQAQDYAGARWALGLRVPGATEAAIERALEAGAIVRTHPMRGTHHFVSAGDVRWMLPLLAPRGLVRSAPRWRQLGLDATTLGAAMRALSRALEGGRHLVRDELAAVLRGAGIATDGGRLGEVLMHAELTGLVCSGSRRGKHMTFALLDERVPPQSAIDRPDLANRGAALAELAARYFATRGPATLRDFVWWSGLTMADARAGAESARGLVSQTIDGTVYWRGPTQRARPAHRAYLLPPFDEYAVAYQARDLLGEPPRRATSWARAEPIDSGPPRSKERNHLTARVPLAGGALTLLGPIVVVDGVVAGTWKRTLGPRAVAIEVAPWRRLARDEAAAVEQAAARYAAFVERPADLRVRSISRSRTS